MQAIAQGQMATNNIGLPKIGAENHGPEKKFRAGAVTATVWKNDRQRATGEPFSYYTIALDRSYKDQAGNWKTAGSMRSQDVPKALLVMQEAYKYVTLNGAADEVSAE